MVSHTDDEKRAIRALAIADKPTGHLLGNAIRAHRELLARVRGSKDGLPYKDPYFEFMREIDTPAPDYMLRCHWREKIKATP